MCGGCLMAQRFDLRKALSVYIPNGENNETGFRSVGKNGFNQHLLFQHAAPVGSADLRELWVSVVKTCNLVM